MKPAQHLTAASCPPRPLKDRMRPSAKSAGHFQPVMASILRRQITARILVAAAALQLLVMLFGVPAWQCPFKSAFGIPGPGCGLSTATVMLFRGEWHTALSVHAFAPLLALAIGSVAVLSLLPRRYYRLALQRLALFESKSGLTGLLLAGFIGYWGLRLFGDSF